MFDHASTLPTYTQADVNLKYFYILPGYFPFSLGTHLSSLLVRCPEASLTVWSTLVKPRSLSLAPSIGRTWEKLWRAGKFGMSTWWTLIRTRTINSIISLWSHKFFGRFWACHPRKICHRSWSWVLKLLKHQTLTNLFPPQENRKAIVSR